MASHIPTESWRYHLRRGITDLWFILSVTFALLLLLILLGYHHTDSAWSTSGNGETQHWFGSIGAYTADILLSLLGYAAYLIPVGIVIIGWQSVRRAYIDTELMAWKFFALFFSVLSLACIFSLHWPTEVNSLAVTAGGIVGQKISVELLKMWPASAVMFIYSLLLLFGITLLAELHWLRITERIGCWVVRLYYAVIRRGQSKDGETPFRLDSGNEPHLRRSTLKERLAPRANVVPPQRTTAASAPLQAPVFSSEQPLPPVAEQQPLSSPLLARNEPPLCSELNEPPLQDVAPPFSWASYKAAKDESSLPTTEVPAAPEDTTENSPQEEDGFMVAAAENYHPKSDYAVRRQAEGASIRDRDYDDGGNLVSEISEEDFAALEDEDDFVNLSVAAPVTGQAAPQQPTAPPFTAAGNIQVKLKPAQIENPRFIRNTEPYRLPDLDLLNPGVTAVAEYSDEELDEMAMLVEHALKNYKLNVRVENIAVGPVVTRIELSLAPGIKVNSVSNLDKDIARSLSVQSVRVVEVIPGKPFIGLEIPNRKREIVPLRGVLEANAYQKEKSPLTLVLGVDISGKPVVANLGKMPHLLVAGTTGSGKSVGINVMLASMLFKAKPDELKLILVDPKMLEMSMYADIPHLLTPVVTDMNDAENALRWAVAEMERRYQLMAAMKVRKIDEFNKIVVEAEARGEAIADPLWNPAEHIGLANQAPNLQTLPYIVIVIDELADMMMSAGKNVEQLIARIAQKARAAGIHLILATQRPSVDVITGLIKANVPTRIAFQVSSKIDSRTILDGQGAEALLGYGDMLYAPPGLGGPQRVHGAFIDDKEVDRLTTYLKQQASPQYEEAITEPVPASAMGALGANEKSDDPEMDPLYDQAVQTIIDTGKASISGLQRHLGIGYNRAARMVDVMERAGLVSAPDNKGVRKVLAGGGNGY